MEQYGGADNYRERLAVNPGLAARIFSLVFVRREQRAGAATSFLNMASAQLLEETLLTAAFPSSQDLLDIGK